jgi:hypothetical protein
MARDTDKLAPASGPHRVLLRPEGGGDHKRGSASDRGPANEEQGDRAPQGATKMEAADRHDRKKRRPPVRRLQRPGAAYADRVALRRDAAPRTDVALHTLR